VTSDAVAGLRDPSIRPVESGEVAVDAFAASYLEDDAAPDLDADLVDAGLAADLGSDLSPVGDDFAPVALIDPGGTDLLEGSLPDDDGIDDG
jgi:hypothetical protein